MCERKVKNLGKQPRSKTMLELFHSANGYLLKVEVIHKEILDRLKSQKGVGENELIYPKTMVK